MLLHPVRWKEALHRQCGPTWAAAPAYALRTALLLSALALATRARSSVGACAFASSLLQRAMSERMKRAEPTCTLQLQDVGGGLRGWG